MPHPAITVENLSKAYRIGAKEEVPDTLTAALTGAIRAPWSNLRRLNRLSNLRQGDQGDDVLWALRDVSFEVNEGEVVGIIGRNGAGKSTLLKILSRITEPTSGRAVICGRVSSLLEVGTGFHPELTGRENVYMNGTILGMTKREIDRKFDEIVDFSGVEKFLDTPTKRYSSGMQVRLAFAVAAHLEPEVLIIDEVLAVGDAEFQKKCLGKMQDVAGSGRTVVFVSHNMAAVRKLTSFCLVLKHGQVFFSGETSDAIDAYIDLNASVQTEAGASTLEYFRRNPEPDSPIRFESIRLCSQSQETTAIPTLSTGERISIDLGILASDHYPDVCISLTLYKNGELPVTTIYSRDTGDSIRLTPGENQVSCDIKALPLSPGRYTICCGINKNDKSKAFDVIQDYPLLEVDMVDSANGTIAWPHRPWGAVHWTEVDWVVK